MSVTLTPEVESQVTAKVASGRYNSPEEVFRVALQLLNEYEQVQQSRLEALRRELAPAIEQADRGQTRRVTLVEMEQRLEAALAAKTAQDTGR